MSALTSRDSTHQSDSEQNFPRIEPGLRSAWIQLDFLSASKSSPKAVQDVAFDMSHSQFLQTSLATHAPIETHQDQELYQ